MSEQEIFTYHRFFSGIDHYIADYSSLFFTGSAIFLPIKGKHKSYRIQQRAKRKQRFRPKK